MDWIKVKVKHAEYDFANAPAEVFKSWIMMMIFVAATERKPLRKDLCNRLGENNLISLENWLNQIGVKMDLIIEKILEDVEHINYRKDHDRKYMRKYRGKHLRKDLRGHDVKGKRREEKIREENIIQTPDFLSSLKTNLAFKHIDVDRELAKMDAWLSAHPGRQKTRSFVVNWLNKIEKPLDRTETTRKIPV